MVTEIRIVQVLRAGDFRQLRAVPTVRAQNRFRVTHFTRLFNDQADFLVIRRYKNRIRIAGNNFCQRRFKIGIFLQESFGTGNRAAGGRERFLEEFSQTLGVIT